MQRNNDGWDGRAEAHEHDASEHSSGGVVQGLRVEKRGASQVRLSQAQKSSRPGKVNSEIITELEGVVVGR